MSLRDRWPAVLTTGVLAFSSGITLYLLLSDKARRSEIRRRKTFLLTAEQEPEREELEMPLTPLERVRTRWGVLRVGGRFVNPFEEWREQGAWEWVTWKVLTLFKFNPAGLPKDRKVLETTIPLYEPDLELLFGSEVNDGDAGHSPLSASWSAVIPKDEALLPPPKHRMTCTWLGQSCSYVQIANSLHVLTDPIFGEYLIAPILGEKRLRPAPLALSDITKLDIILVSHNHFDHLEDASVRRIGNSARWYVPIGMKDWFHRRGIYNLVEMQWWQEVSIPSHPEYHVVATPAMHWSARHPFHTNTTLWNSYLLIHRPTPTSPSHPLLFHAGDTGYVPTLYSDIATLYGTGCDLALLPIGSYSPRWHLKQQHCDPQDVVKMHLELGAKRTVGVHYATWILSDENYLAPPTELGVAARERGVESACVPGEMGRTVVFPIEGGGGESGGMSPVESVESGEKSLDGEKGLGGLSFREIRGGKSVLWC